MKKMYPKVKVRGEVEEDDQYAFEKSSLQSLKAFEWLSLHDSTSPDESPQSPVRVPGSYFPKSEDNKKAGFEESRTNGRASSVPPPRAVLSSPDNDGIDRSRVKMRRDPLPGLKNHKLCQNRHAQCKATPIYAVSFTSSVVNNNESIEKKIDHQQKSSTVIPKKSFDI